MIPWGGEETVDEAGAVIWKPVNDGRFVGRDTSRYPAGSHDSIDSDTGGTLTKRFLFVLMMVGAISGLVMGQRGKPADTAAAPKKGNEQRGSAGATEETAMAALPPGTKHEHLMLPLKDGVKLATEIFLPPEGEGPWPVVLMRTPYSRWDVERRFNAMGDVKIAIVTQNVRGRYGSEGAGTFDRESFANEVEDSYDVIEWIAKQKWCNGKVGMVGASGHGMAACNAVWCGAPHLVAVQPTISADSSEFYWSFHNGVRREFYSWLSERGIKVEQWPRPTVRLIDVAAREKFLKDRGAACKVAVINDSGWYDLFSQAVLDQFVALAPTNRVYIRISNQGHGGIGGGLTYPKIQGINVPFPSFKEWMTKDPATLKSESTLAYCLMGDARDPQRRGTCTR